MAFNLNNYKAPVVKRLPVILLLDISSSISEVSSDSLYSATIEMIETLAALQTKDMIIDMAIITFGQQVELHTRYTSVKDLYLKGIQEFRSSKVASMGSALKMAKDIIDSKRETPSGIYRPTVVLVSSGQANDDWKESMDKFITTGRSAKCQRFAVGISNNVDESILLRFTQDSRTILFKENFRDISEQFKAISLSVLPRCIS